MRVFGRKGAWILAFLGLAVFLYHAHGLRSISYHLIPEEILDERTNVWHGLSIRNTGVPLAWSDLGSYKEISKGKSFNGGLDLEGYNLTIEGRPLSFRNFWNYPKPLIYTTELDFGYGSQYSIVTRKHISLVQPYMDHPPLGALGLGALLDPQEKNIYNLSIFDIRKTSIYLASITSILIFIASYIVFKNLWIAFFAFATYNSVPTFVISSRYALLENVLILVELLALIVLLIYQKFGSFVKKHNLMVIALLGVISGAAFLIKTTGIFVGLAVFIVLSLDGIKKKEYLVFLSSLGFFILVYIGWGVYNSLEVFKGVLNEQSSMRIFVGSLNFLTSTIKFGVNGFPVDGWWMGGFLALMLLNFGKEMRVLAVFCITTIFTILFTGPSFFPWYILPLVPLMCIMTGYFLYDLIARPKLISVMIFFLVFFSSSFFWSVGVLGASPKFLNHQMHFLIYRILVLAAFGLGILSLYTGKHAAIKKYWFTGGIFLIIFTFALNFKSLQFILENWGKLVDTYTANWKF